MICEYFLFDVVSKVQFQSGTIEEIPTFVHAKNEHEAKKIAYDYLMSGKSGYKVFSVLFQYLSISDRFLADSKNISENYPFV